VAAKIDDTPPVSIGLPVYNGDPYIEATLDSLLTQTFQDLEIIISDNASTDRTAEICRRYAEKDSRIRYFRNSTNIGSARNFNQTVTLASGKYFKSASADDLAAPELVEKCVAVLDHHPEVVLCYGKSILIDEHGRFLREYEDRLDLRSANTTERFSRAVQDTGLVNILQGVMRINALRKTAILGRYVGSDVILAAELALYGQFYELPERLFFRRIHPAAYSSQPTLEGRLAYMDPSRKDDVALHVWRQYSEYIRAICRSPVSPAAKTRLILWILRRAISVRAHLLGEVSVAVRQMFRR
jgi:glycosyltransferase involved in cell wall biosynthesis